MQDISFPPQRGERAMEGIKTVDAKMSVLLHPSRAGDVLLGVQEILNSLLLRFNEQFEGVILAYLAPKIVTQNAKILTGLLPYFHVTLTVKLLLFSPTPGMKIEGKVIKIEKDYIGVLVLGLFNTTIGVMDIRQDLDYIASQGGKRAWVSCTDHRHKVKLGSLIRFSVKSLQEAENIIDIRGSLEGSDTGCVKWIERAFSRSTAESTEPNISKQSGSLERERKKKKKRRDTVQELVTEAQNAEQSIAGANTDPAEAGLQRSTERLKGKKERIRSDESPVEFNHKFKRKKTTS